ncbi:hypothetical protein HZA38_03485 [Candidatus Peregrinibacteria bacterium]|nr:hypothetical protein [Candidatus Peregrinibacteria bacterium]
MKLIITTSIKKIELEPIQKVFSLEMVKIAAEKALEGLGEKIKSAQKIPATSLQKLYLTSSHGAGRAIFLLKIGMKTSVLVMIRMKNDKKVGSNMTIKNQSFKIALEKNLERILKDLKNADYEEYVL